MKAYTQSYWDHMKLPLHERLLKEAEAEDRAAESLKHCSWTGYEHPAASHRRRAAELREAAFRIRYAEEAPQRRREAAQQRREKQHRELMDAMQPDADW